MRLSLFLAFLITAPVFAQQITLEGRYQGKNMYIQNPRCDTGFCTKYFTVNGKQFPGPESEAYEIRLDTLGFKLHDTLTVVIHHKTNCKPKVLQFNHSPNPTFEITAISVSDSGFFKWSTTKENGKLPFIIEQFRWNRWVKIGEVEGKGDALKNEYSFQVIPHSGENKVRVKQVGVNGTPLYSKHVTFTVKTKAPKIKSNTGEFLILDQKTMYQIYDEKGSLISQGYADKIPIQDLKQGSYFLNYDNLSTEFKKKK